MKNDKSNSNELNENIKLFSLDESRSVRNALHLGFVDLEGDSRPVENKSYNIISASNASIELLPIPSSNYKRINIDLLLFFVDHLPDFLGGVKEGLFKVSINTRDPQNLSNNNDVTLAVDFKVKDGNYASGFLHKGLYRNVIISNWINIKFDLYELDTDGEVYIDKIKNIVDGVPGIKNLDILNGIPYLNLATKLFEGIVRTFGKNPDDHIWGEIPIIEINPSIGGAFLRNGLYIVFETVNSRKEQVKFENLYFKNSRIEIKDKSIKRLPNHLLFNIGIMPHTES